MRAIVNFFKDERGLELPEYAVNAAIIIGLTAAVLTAVATAITGRYNLLANTINNP